MKQIRTRHFKIALSASAVFSAVLLLFFILFGKSIASVYFDGMTELAFSVIGLAAGSFLAFSFIPYFHGDRRWYSISALLTVVFFGCAVVLWQVPATAVIG